MSRKTVMWSGAKGRDDGKTFLLTEMSALAGEEWAMRSILALMAGNVNLPDGFEGMGMAGMAEIGIRGLGQLKWDVAKPLLEEMMTCVQFVPNAQKPHVVRSLIDSDIEEIGTRFALRMEVLKLHLDFLEAVAPSVFPSKAATAAVGAKSHTKTSQS